MPKYSDPMHPRHAARRFSGQPGNYVLHFDDGSTYAGRQAEAGRRLETHVRRHSDLTAIQFMVDHEGSSCVRATRERMTVEQLREQGRPIRNRIQPSMPTACVALTRTRVRAPAPVRARQSGSTAGAILLGLGIAGLLGFIAAALSKGEAV